MPFYDLNWAATPSAVIRDGDYFEAREGDRYVTRPRLEFYDLKVDLSEKRNLAEQESVRTARPRTQLHACIKSCGA